VFEFFLSKKKIIEFVNSYGLLAPLAFIGLQVFQVVLAPIPGEVTGFIGGFLFGNILGVLYSTIGLTLGSWLAFSLSKILGQPLVERVIPGPHLKKLDTILAHQGALVAFLLFLIPGFPKDYLSFFLGLGHMPTHTFLFISIPGRLLGTILLTVQGYYFRQARYGPLAALVLVSLGVLLIFFLFRGRIEKLLRARRRDHKE
jgi:uncharacterized membrane protein YdjX (TVP38/TMEM64 family)